MMGLEAVVPLLIAILVIAVVIYGVKILFDMIVVPQGIKMIVYLIIFVLVIVWLLGYLNLGI